MHEAAADALVRQMREYSPEPPHSRSVYADLSPDGRRFFRKLAGQMIERESLAQFSGPLVFRGGRVGYKLTEGRQTVAVATRSAEGIEAACALLREGIELLASRDKRDRLVIRASLAIGGVGSLAGVLSLFLR